MLKQKACNLNLNFSVKFSYFKYDLISYKEYASNLEKTNYKVLKIKKEDFKNFEVEFISSNSNNKNKTAIFNPSNIYEFYSEDLSNSLKDFYVHCEPGVYLTGLKFSKSKTGNALVYYNCATSLSLNFKEPIVKFVSEYKPINTKIDNKKINKFKNEFLYKYDIKCPSNHLISSFRFVPDTNNEKLALEVHCQKVNPESIVCQYIEMKSQSFYDYELMNFKSNIAVSRISLRKYKESNSNSIDFIWLLKICLISD